MNQLSEPRERSSGLSVALLCAVFGILSSCHGAAWLSWVLGGLSGCLLILALYCPRLLKRPAA